MNMKDYMAGRNEGMAYALKIAKEKGIEELEKECKFRNVTNIPSQVSTKACEEAIERIKLNTIDTITILAITTLRDEFGFGPIRLKRFRDRFHLKADCLVGGYVTWDDMIQELSDDKIIKLSIRKNC